MTPLLTYPLLAVFPALVIFGALKDITTFTIPNWLSGLLAAAFLPAALAAGLPLGVMGLHLGVGFGFLVAGVAMFAAGWIGGGDAKLFAAAALWLGWPAGLYFLLYTTLAGGALAVGLVTARKSQLAVVAGRAPQWVGRLLEKNGPAPYGVAIAAGALAAFPLSPFVNAVKTFVPGV